MISFFIALKTLCDLSRIEQDRKYLTVEWQGESPFGPDDYTRDFTKEKEKVGIVVKGNFSDENLVELKSIISKYPSFTRIEKADKDVYYFLLFYDIDISCFFYQ